MNKEINLEKLKETITDSTNVQELFEIADDLWNHYFLTEKLTKAQKTDIRTLYNLAASKANKHAGKDVVILLTASTRWEPKKDKQEQPVPRLTPVHAGTIAVTVKAATKQENKVIPAKKAGPGGSIIEQILAHHKKGLSNKDIIALGFNKSTVNRQVSEYKKRINNVNKENS